MMNKTALMIGLMGALTIPAASAGMLAVEVGIMDWSDRTEAYFGEGKSENEYIAIKGATGNAFGDVFAIVKLEDFTDSDLMGSEINIVGQINMGDSDFNWYGQVFNKQKPVWSETNTLLGFSHDKTWDNGWYTQVALAGHVVTSDYAHFKKANGESFDANGFNGGYAYIGVSKDFSAYNQDFSFNWWQEHYFGRGDDYLIVSGDIEDHGFNGSANLRWHISGGVSAAISYRYAQNNLGKEGWQNAMFYSMQYNF
ncbi:hypothetical protein AB4160_10855 [Shewanella sp. 10N.286.51.B8]|uniref:hypothetical protein n=1 Tax=unclassified Shewanella TaxID=196818 RepID=UPI0026E3906B|nr:hypothetical protein [Shewanella sp. 6_MG-2023]MDO6618439.1 hypothetical protein [Shewanella sp. 6_MG-2023]